MAVYGAERAALITRPIDAAVTSWIAAVVAGGGSVTGRERQILSDFVTVDKASGYWSSRGDIFWFRASNAIAAKTSLILHNVATTSTGGLHVPNGGLSSMAANSFWHLIYIATVVNVGTGSNFHISVRETVNITSGGQDSGNIVTSGSKLIGIVTRSGANSFIAALNSANVTWHSGTQLISTGTFTATRNNTTYTGYIDGVSLGTGAPGTNGTVYPAIEFLLAGRNNNGTPDTFRPNIYEYWSFGAAPTDAQITAADQALTILSQRAALSDIYVASTGSDTTGSGTAAAPFATLAKGVAAVGAGGNIIFSASPAAMASVTTTVKAYSMSAASHLGATISGFDTTRILILSPTTGITESFTDLLFDASANVGGAALRCLEMSTQTLQYNINVTNCKFQGWTGVTNGCAIVAASTGLKVNLQISGTTFVGTNCAFSVAANSVAAGASLYLSGNTYTNTGGTVGCYCVSWIATSAGTYFHSTGDTASNTPDVTAAAGLYGGIYSENCLGAIIEDFTVTVDTNGGIATISGVWAAYNLLHDDGTVSIDGSIVRNGTVSIKGIGGGVGALIGADSGGNGHASQCNDCLMDTVAVTGDANFITGGGHTHLLGNTTDSRVQSCTGTTAALGGVSKHNTRAYWYACTFAQQTSAYLLAKGDTNTTFDANIVNITAGFEGDGIRVENEPVSGDNSTGIVVTNNVFTITGTTANAVVVFADQTATFSNNTYNAVSGGAFTFSYLGVTLTPAQWKAQVEPTALGNIF